MAEKLLLVLRDGRKLIGVLRSWDQFGMNRTRSCCGSRTETGAWENSEFDATGDGRADLH